MHIQLGYYSLVQNNNAFISGLKVLSKKKKLRRQIYCDIASFSIPFAKFYGTYTDSNNSFYRS